MGTKIQNLSSIDELSKSSIVFDRATIRSKKV